MTDHITRRFCFRYHAAGNALNLAAQEVSYHSSNRYPADRLSPEAYRAISDDISSRLPGAAAYCIDGVIADYTGRNSYMLTVSGTVDYPA